MVSANREGVIKFQLDFEEGAPPAVAQLCELNAWREVFRRLGLLGQDPARYDGFGFGNLSRRLTGRERDAFVITGTQTGHLQDLRPEHYATVLQCNPIANQLAACGQTQPSSEALSHGVIYQCAAEISWVMHLHSPEIFDQRLSLGLPCTDPGADYGTPAMAWEIQRLAGKSGGAQPGLLVMGGHRDGLLAYGTTATATGGLVVATLALALQHAGLCGQAG